eukprot:CAMPEP_0175977986 /NCGR_PEP_ID=MMETSP0108-20121206/45389_1 /TAXON_ID=195067 ORGANISM="Goniomonas pacifica, Strain CCMP1869" /NCGR_SAMPLE_ID=MMETSP0108 /ASSEMBLY_ACC=CAM_ASM_000204 /LENGTH=69 /DNA_ID=CAMNT_0017308075 /DNA_START=381 /DNA_END=587 /DNA_ORIENTATION=-
MPVCGQACTWQCAPQVDKCEMFGRNVWGLVVLLEHQLFPHRCCRLPLPPQEALSILTLPAALTATSLLA